MELAENFIFPLKEKTIIITGGASGIGRAVALIAAKAEAKIVVIDLNRELLETLRDEIGRSDDSLIIEQEDVTNQVGMKQIVQRTADKFGAIDGLVCSAGISVECPFLEVSSDLWNRIIQLNLAGTFFVSQAVAQVMADTGRGGSIVTLSSAQGVMGRINGSHYSASKAGVLGLTKSMALELAKYQIRVNCVAPGAVETPLMRQVVAKAVGGEQRSLAKILLGRFGQPDDIASMICFLLSDLTSWVTGQTLHVNGGSLLV